MNQAYILVRNIGMVLLFISFCSLLNGQQLGEIKKKISNKEYELAEEIINTVMKTLLPNLRRNCILGKMLNSL